MWLAARLLAALIGFLFRLIGGRRAWGLERRGKVGDLEIWESVHRTKDKKGVMAYTLAAELRAPVVFRLSKERAADRFFKALGIATEIQTGDELFDRRVYIVCDHDGLAAVLRHNQAARSAVLAALASGLDSIVLDGRFLRVWRGANYQPSKADLKHLEQLHRAFAVLSTELGRRFQDRYFWRMALVEGLTWSLFAYGALAFIQLFVRGPQVHVDEPILFLKGLAVAALVFGGLVTLIVLFLRGSSGGARILVEGIALLLIGLPAAGIQMTADINTTLDAAPPVQHVGAITQTRATGRRGKRYYVEYRPEGSEAVKEIRVSRDTYLDAARGRKLRVTVGPGRLGLKWYKEVIVTG